MSGGGEYVGDGEEPLVGGDLGVVDEEHDLPVGYQDEEGSERAEEVEVDGGAGVREADLV